MKGLLRLAFLSVAVLLAQGNWALAGVTGSLNGTVLVQGRNTPVAQAKVTASAASQTSTATTDNTGHFSIVSLIPDTYTVTVTKENVIEPTVQRGVTVVADQVVNLVVLAKPYVKVLATEVVRAGGLELVRPGQTQNVYSVDPQSQARTASLGGGGGADQGYSSIAALPGAYVSPGQAGWYQVVNIRGGDYDQVGYEFDGVPINRSFDNYPTNNLSAIGQQELQLYTGATPAVAEGQGIAGYINQVIKSGTYPGYGTLNFAIGGPALYNKASFEVGGATPNRNLSYYIGIGVVNSNLRTYDNNNGASQNATYGGVYDFLSGPPGAASQCGTAAAMNFVGCYHNTAYFLLGTPAGPGGYLLGPYPMYSTALFEDRENVFNVHIGLPHPHDGGKDDIQLLYDAFQLYTWWYSSPNDWGGPSFFALDTTGLEGPGLPTYSSGYQSNIPLGTTFAAMDASQAANIVRYAYPSNAGFSGQPLPATQKGAYSNGSGVYKLQYQHNIGTQSYLRLYGYSFYSWWFNTDTTGAWDLYLGTSPDYELWTHTHGGALQYVNQVSPQHLVEVEGSYTTASTVRNNNSQMFNAGGSRSWAAQLVSAANPSNGVCYSTANPGVPGSCLKDNANPSAGSFGSDMLSFGSIFAGGVTAPSGTACGGPCAWYISENGPYATYNTVTPKFWGISLQDTWKPNDRLNLNIGVRDSIYGFGFTPTGGGTRNYWFAAWNNATCVNPAFNGGNPFDKTISGSAWTPVNEATPCSSVSAPGFPAGSFVPATLTNTTANGGSTSYTVFEPRLGGTYTMDPDNVIRFSGGRYSSAPGAYGEQYNHLAQDLPEALIGTLFYRYGFTGPAHAIKPSISYNYDLSWEHRFKNTQTSFVVTPFVRQTQNQVQSLYIAPTQAFVSGFNVGNERNVGAEFLLLYNNFNANGLAAQLSYTYTHSYITYSLQPNGVDVLAQDNIDIQRYNSYTSACTGVASTTTATCGTNAGTFAFPCFVGGVGTAAAGCGAAGAVSNPYYNMPAQPLLDPNGRYAPYDIIPVGVQLSSTGYVVPHVAALVLQYKRDKWAFIPAVQFHSGVPYGAPETTNGFDPSTCPVLAGGNIATDPRYPAGSVGNPADAVMCTGSLVIPDQFTGKFDNVGAFTEPSQLNVHFGIQYEATPRVTYTVNLANIVNTCFGGSNEPWVVGDHHYCLYGGLPGFISPVGNFYNPGATFQTFARYPYFPGATGDNGYTGTTTPFQASFNVQIKL